MTWKCYLCYLHPARDAENRLKEWNCFCGVILYVQHTVTESELWRRTAKNNQWRLVKPGEAWGPEFMLTSRAPRTVSLCLCVWFICFFMLDVLSCSKKHNCREFARSMSLCCYSSPLGHTDICTLTCNVLLLRDSREKELLSGVWAWDR